VLDHWSAETIHFKLDDIESYAEDKCRIHRGNAPEFLSIMRKLGLNFMSMFNNTDKNQDGSNPSGIKKSVRMILDLFQRSPPFLEAVLTKSPQDVGSPESWRKKIRRRRFSKYYSNYGKLGGSLNFFDAFVLFVLLAPSCFHGIICYD
jgi:hypothetical protein